MLRRRVGRRLRRRARHHVVLLLATVAAGMLIIALLDSEDPWFQLSMATAYVSLGWLTVTLLLGPFNVLRGRPNPVSVDLRRDVGIWAGVVGAAHFVVGLQVHFRGRPEQYFLFPQGWDRLVPVRYDAFGVANWAGLGAVAILMILLVTSNDLSLRRLGTARWKALHRLSYACVALVGVHAVVYQVLEDRSWSWVFVSSALILVAVVLQLLGRLRRRGRTA